jgi:hypothetical protein
MNATVTFHPGNPNLFELYGLLLTILLAAYLVNALYEWLKKKPWKKKERRNLENGEHTSHNPVI